MWISSVHMWIFTALAPVTHKYVLILRFCFSTAKPDLPAFSPYARALFVEASKEINEFVSDRYRKWAQSLAPSADEEKYSKETMKQYREKFDSRVITVRNGLAEKGLRDKELDAFSQFPTNRFGMRRVAEKISALVGGCITP